MRLSEEVASAVSSHCRRTITLSIDSVLCRVVVAPKLKVEHAREAVNVAPNRMVSPALTCAVSLWCYIAMYIGCSPLYTAQFISGGGDDKGFMWAVKDDGTVAGSCELGG